MATRRRALCTDMMRFRSIVVERFWGFYIVNTNGEVGHVYIMCNQSSCVCVHRGPASSHYYDILLFVTEIYDHKTTII